MSEAQLRTALVTGAGSGIGRATVKALCQAGLEVHALDRDAENLRSLSRQADCVTHLVDLRDTAKLESEVSTLAIDLLACIAGVLPRLGGVETFSRDEIDALIDVNLRAPTHLCRLLLPRMVERNRGHVFMLGSCSGLRAMPNVAVYSATKAGIHMLCRTLRFDLVGKNIRVTEIAPGRVESAIYDGVFGSREAANEKLYDNFDSLQPEDIADLILVAMKLPPHCDVSLLEVYPTMQATGGMTTVLKNQ